VFGLYLGIKQDLDISRELRDTSFSAKTDEADGRNMDVMLKTRCGGLIETDYQDPEAPDGSDFSPFWKVSYMHQTVQDFLMAPENQKILLVRTNGMKGRGPNPNVAIFKSIVLQIIR